MIMRIVFATAVAAALSWTTAAFAASAVAINPQTNQYTWHAGPSVEGAEAEALAACEKLSGGACRLFSRCGLPGEGAIAFNKTTGSWGAICGSKDAEAAADFALENCNLRAQGSGSCDVVERFTDKNLGETVAKGYFAGEWSENCDATAGDRRWHGFRFVNPLEFRIVNCTADGCADGREIFRPMLGESVFHWPTDNTRLAKRGPDMMQMTKLNSVFLNRCTK